MFTYTRNERKWVRETTLYPLSFPLALLKQKRVPNFFGTRFAVRTGLVTGLPLCLQRTLPPGHGESIYKKKKKPCGFFLRCVRDSNP